MRSLCLFVSLFAFFIVSCSPQVVVTQIPTQPTLLPTNTSQPVITQTIPPNPTIVPITSCQEWQSWPVIPIVSENVRDMY